MDELFNQLMARVPDPSEYAQQELEGPLSEFPGAKLGEMPVDLGVGASLYKTLANLPATIKASRPAAALYQQLMNYKFTPGPADLAEATRASKVTGMYQPPSQGVIRAPEGFKIPPFISKKLPTEPIARRVMSERQALRAAQVKALDRAKAISNRPPPAATTGNLMDTAASVPQSSGQVVRKLTIREQRAKGIEIPGYTSRKRVGTVLPEFEAYVVDQAKKWQGSMTELHKRLGMNMDTLKDILTRNGIKHAGK